MGDRASSEDGFLLLEVIMSAVMVGFIVIATFTGFGVVNRASANERNRSEAAVLASESQEQLRSNSAIGLHELAESGNAYKRTVGGTIFTITQKASPGNGAGQTGCVSAETGGKGKGVYFLISSTVTWEHMVGNALVQSTIVTPPTGSALEVEVSNGELPTEGVTVSVTYTPIETTGTTTLEGTTGAQGCVLFAGLPTTSALVEVKETRGIVNAHGTLSWPTKTVTLAPNVVTPDPVELAPAGALEALYRFNKSATYTHKNNANTKELTESVKGDTFVSYNQKMGVEPFFETGGNSALAKFGTSGLYEMILASPVGTYGTSAISPKEATSNYPNGNLFPFPAAAEGKWTGYAGDCTANNPKTYSVTPPTAAVSAGVTSKIEVPVAYDQLEVFQGTSVLPGSLETTNSELVTITNKGCKGVTPNNGTALDITHTQGTTTGSEWGGHLEVPFQPFGEFELCLLAEPKPGVKHAYTLKEPYVNKSATEKLTRKIYLGELSSQEIEAARVKSEAETEKKRLEKEAATRAPLETKENETKTKREATEVTTRKTAEAKEAETKTKREATEVTTRKTAEAKEATTQTNREATEATTKKNAEALEETNREKWKKEKEKNQISEATRNAKIAAQTTERTNREKTEATNKKNAETAEATTQATREASEATLKKTEETKEASTKATRETSEATLKKAEETKEATTKSTREKTEEGPRKTEEAKEEATQKAAETAEKATLAAKEVVVETKPSC